MKQWMQNLDTGRTELFVVPAPQPRAGHLTLHTHVTLISAGTERMLVDFGKASYLQKARQQPEKVKMVLDKMKTDGVFATLDAVRAKLSQPLPLGYCHVGMIKHVGAGISGFKVGERVVSNGPHAEVVNVPPSLCARIPDSVSDEAAAFTVLASIGLQGIRLVQPTLGESVVVIGAGLIGLLTVQLLRAQGCRVLAIDVDERPLALAKQFGAQTCCIGHGEDPVAAGLAFSQGRGVDAVLITASTTSSDPVSQAAQMSRQRGRIVLVGVTGLTLNRSDFYEKELSFQVSCSYGPGRYDPSYEQEGHDYPLGFVRWTVQRNFEAVLALMEAGSLDVSALITHRFLFEDADRAYQLLTQGSGSLGMLLQCTSAPEARDIKTVTLREDITFDPKKPTLGVIGAGQYASRGLLPAFKAAGAAFKTLVTLGGVNGVIQGQKVGFEQASTDVEALFADRDLNTVVVVTRHDTHAPFVVRALNAGKHVFVEKPLAIDLEGLAAIEAAYHTRVMTGNPCLLMVGFNRRFSPHVQKMKALLSTVNAPKTLVMTINAGAIPQDHWTQDARVGGGRILGEACHFIDLMRHLVGHEIISVQSHRLEGRAQGLLTDDTATITLRFAEGSLGTIHYLSNGSTRFPKERVEVFTSGRVLQLDNFRRLTGFGWPGFRRQTLWRQDKGQIACAAAFLNAITHGTPSPIPPHELFEVARYTLDVVAQLRAF